MYWAKIINEQLVYIPNEIYDETTSEVTVLNTYNDYFDRGYKPVKFNKPSFNNRTQMLVYDGFIETGIDIQIQYKIVELNPTENLENIFNEEVNL